MKRLLAAALMLVTILVQVIWAPRLTIAGVFPNLALVAVIAVTWTAGVRSGMVWACVAGLMLDLTAPGPLGPHAVALLAGAYLTGFWTRNVDPESVLHPMLAAAAGTAAYSMIRDTDYAAESAVLARGRVMQGSALHMLTMANASPAAAMRVLG